MADIIMEMRQRVAEIGRLLFERKLTDAAGGNISARAGDVLCMSPRYSGSRFQWHLKPEDVLVVDLEGNKLEGAGDVSREAASHFKLMREFPDGGALIHAHPRNVMVFVMAKQPIYPVLEGTLKFGVVQVSRYAPAHSKKLADYLAETFRGQEAIIRKQGAAVIGPWHGLFVIGKDLDAAFDSVERIDTNAYCILMSRLLPGMADRTPEEIHQELLRDLEHFADA
jgi:L-fuculose-phosphate aldolase